MSFEKKEWKNRLSENPVRRTLTPVDGGSAMVVDVTRNEGTIMQQGDPFNAENMNDLENRIEAGIGGGQDIVAPAEEEQSLNAYAVGDKLIFDGVLYNVISPIAVGNTLVPDVNISETTVGGLITTIEGELTANGNRMYMDYQDGKYGVNTSPSRGADTFIPFNKAIDLTNAVDLNPTTSTSCTINNALDYSLIIATGMGAHEYVTGYVNITTTDPTTNKFFNNVGAHYTGSAATLVYVPSVNTATITEYSNAQVMQMGVYGILKD